MLQLLRKFQLVHIVFIENVSSNLKVEKTNFATIAPYSRKLNFHSSFTVNYSFFST